MLERDGAEGNWVVHAVYNITLSFSRGNRVFLVGHCMSEIEPLSSV